MEMEKFFFPQSLVIFGVSEAPTNLSSEILKNVNRFSFKGRVYGLGRKEMEIEGIKVYSDIDLLPEVPDLAVLLIPATAVTDAVEVCGRKGIRHVVIESGGFAEFGNERKDIEEEIRWIAQRWDITCMGPNCIGVINVENGLCLPFVPFAPEEMRKGKNSFISQSGGLIHEMVRRCLAENAGLSKLVSIGNKMTLDENDLLQYFIEDPETGTIGMYLEDVKDGRRLMDLALGTKKPIIVLKGNSSPTGREIASFHTAALVGDNGAMEAAFKQAGIHQVMTPQEMVETFNIFDLPPMKGPNLGVVSRSGGQCVLLADQVHRHGFSLAKVSSDVFDFIEDRSKLEVIKRTNPIDIGDIFDPDFYPELIEAVLKQKSVDGVVFFFDYKLNDSIVCEMPKNMEKLCRRFEKPVVLCMVPDKKNWIRARYESSFPFFTEPERAFCALRRSLEHSLKKNAAGGRAVSFCGMKTWPRGMEMDVQRSSRIASMEESLALMAAYNLPVPESKIVRNAEEGAKAAREMGYPVVLKQLQPFILHKTEVGAVKVGISDEVELKRAFEKMDAKLYLVQKMVPEGIETIVGGKRDSQFGEVVMFGLGGVFVEVLKDIVIRVAPIDEAVALEMIEGIKGAPLLKGARGNEPADVASIAKILVDVSRMMVEHPEILDLDINPLRVFAQGTGSLALDVKMEFFDYIPRAH